MNKTPSSVFEGTLNADGLRFAIVCARFNDFLVRQLLDGALDSVVRHGGNADNVAVAWVPGSYEIPLVANTMAESGQYDAVIGLGVVIQGATPHAQHIGAAVANGLCEISRRTGVPVIDGVVTTESIEQAIERSGTKAGNRGSSAVTCAIEMANLMKALAQK